ncbi:hypothetical protein B0T25DRAFT_539958 [Lasiosphaeria hispida]|uniref:Uncharacterized protein n=1 Tax=Lasiosphaeria hispida TaxID=260671 RepID=A0AAJ0HMZ1_9PEZI|nr:hypothetical protein B0T25DRAFT_539958 [Lasiosphaeria hispida]
MPRPKRSRIASRPAARQQQSSASPPPTIKPATAQREPPPDGFSSDIYDVSDREKELRKTRSNAKLAKDQEGRAHHEFDMNSEQGRAMEETRRRRDEAMNRLDNLTSTSKPLGGSSANNGAGSPAIEYSRREESTMAATTRQARLTDASGLDLDDEIFGNLDDSLEDSHNAVDDTHSAHHTQSTNTSSFNVGMFRRRPRQSSIVGKDDAPIRPSSRGPNTPSVTSYLNLGRFKRRAREPSILGTAQKERAQRPQSQASNYESAAGEDSGPDDESTPLDKTKRHSGPSQLPTESSPEPEASPVLPSRKRKSLEDQAGREKRRTLNADVRSEKIHQSIEVGSTPPGSPSPQDDIRPSTPLSDDPDMAPPASSGSSFSGSPIIWPSLDVLAHRTYARKPVPAREQKTPEVEDDGDAASDASSLPSLTHSPNFVPADVAKTRTKRKPTAPPPKISTADLTSLLPRRRHKAAVAGNNTESDGEEYDSADHGDEEDELAYGARRRRAVAQPLGKSAAANRGGKGKGKETAAQRKLRTYGSQNKENEEETVVGGSEEEETGGGEEGVSLFENTETSEVMLGRMGEELKEAKKKFKEVDRWELSFEEVVESSSPLPNAR